MDEVQEKANVLLKQNTTDVSADGSVSTLGMPTAKPGDTRTIQVPYCGCSGDKNIDGIKHSLSAGGFLTQFQIEDRQVQLSDLFKERIDAEEMLKPYNNVNNMSDSYTVYFNETPTITTLVNAEIDDDNRLRLTSGSSSGTAIFDEIVTDSNIIQCEFRVIVNYPNHEDCTYEVSNNGSTFTTISEGSLHTFTTSGNQLVFKINLRGDATHNPVFDSVCLLYKVI